MGEREVWDEAGYQKYVTMMYLHIELAKMDNSSIGYERIREMMESYLNTFRERMPKGLIDFITDEMLRERPFYPDKGKGKLSRVVFRSARIGVAIRRAKEEDPALNIYDDIIPKIAERENVSIPSVKQDYEARFLPVVERAVVNAMKQAKDHLFKEEVVSLVKRYAITRDESVIYEWAKKSLPSESQ